MYMYKQTHTHTRHKRTSTDTVSEHHSGISCSLLMVRRETSTPTSMDLSFRSLSLSPSTQSSDLDLTSSSSSRPSTNPSFSNCLTCSAVLILSFTTLSLDLFNRDERETRKVPRENTSSWSSVHPSSGLGRLDSRWRELFLRLVLFLPLADDLPAALTRPLPPPPPPAPPVLAAVWDFYFGEMYELNFSR